MRLVALLIVGAAGVIVMLTPFGRSVELRAYDSALRFLPDPSMDDGIVIVGIDDTAVNRVGSWPWSRDVVADGLLEMRALGARHLVLDIEYPDPSPVVVDTEEFQSSLDDVFGTIAADMQDLAGALESGRIQPDGAARVLDQFAGGVTARGGPGSRLAAALRDRDTYLANAISATGSTIVAASWSEEARPLQPSEPTFPPQTRSLTVEPYELPVRAEYVATPIPGIARGARGMGFVNVTVDPDGVSRRSDLVVETEHGYLPALGLVPLVVDGYTQLEAPESAFVLSNGSNEIRIPRTEEGRMLLRWHRGQIQEGFTTVSFERIIELQRLLEDLAYYVRLMQDAGYLDALPGTGSLLDVYDQARDIRRQMTESGDPMLMDRYGPRIQTFLSDVARLAEPDAEEPLLQLLNEQPDSEARERIRGQIEDIFATVRGLLSDYEDLRTRLARVLDEATVFIGFTATSTTDVGVTPFEEAYLNVGMHATMLRTLRNAAGLDELPPIVGIIVLAVALVLLLLSVELLPPRIATPVGFAIVVVQIAGSWLVFVMTGLFAPVSLASIFSFVGLALVVALTYVMTERDKRTIRQAFEHYLSPHVISVLLEQPDRLNVGGEERELTAMFTDVEQFTTVVDRLEPTAVVDLLGEYLAEMTSPLLSSGGTIDKYEGDAIVAFFGAPLDDPRHARRACAAAIEMRRLEPVLNDRLVRSGMTPIPLRTRIGLHTGQMTVGNLGTPERLDYTIIGPEVNLASRLENVNKQYGTWTIMSEETCNAAGEGLLFRRMDRVRVVGSDRPVRLYELLGYADDSTSALREALELFATGLSEFEERNWERARTLFETVLRIYPTDGPAGVFIERCNTFLREGVRDTWDGVISLAEK